MTWLAKTLFAGVIATGVIGGGLYWQLQEPVLEDPRQVIVVDLPSGSGVRTLAHSLSEQDVAFRWQTRLAGMWYLQHGETVKAGRYILQGPLMWDELFARLTKGEAESMTLTLVEGKRWQDFRSRIQKSELIADPGWLNQPDEAITAALRGERQDWVCPPGVLEGCLMPNTYRLYMGITTKEILKNAYVSFNDLALAVWNQRDPGLPLRNPYEMVILASMVEKETARTEDRGRIARVFVNRLLKGMRLQSDPTVIYGVPNFDGNLTREHLNRDQPFNTYTRAGLPPSPIAAPSRASLEAVAHPEPGSWLYFVARPDGRSVFSENLSSHNEAVWQYQVEPARSRNFNGIPRVHH